MRCLDKNNLVSGYKQERKKLTPIERKIKKKTTLANAVHINE